MTAVRHLPPLELLELPNEVLIKICGSAKDQDLPNLRLSCSKLCDAANPQFAKVNFTERFHVVSPYSIDTLVKITEHPVFGGYVKTVSISSARQTRRHSTLDFLSRGGIYDSDLCLNSYVKTRRFARRMERVFGNIRSRSVTVAIGIYDYPRQHRYRACGWTQLHKSTSAGIIFRTAETLEEVIYAARRARCPVKSLRIIDSHSGSQIMHDELDAAMHRVLESNLVPLSINLDNRQTCQMSYDYKSYSLLIRGICDEGYGYGKHYLGLHASYNWLLTQKTAQLGIVDIYDHPFTYFQPFLSYNLRRLLISRTSLFTVHFDQSLWSEVIETISGLSGLQYCRLDNLVYCLDLEYYDDHVELLLPGHGQYPMPELSSRFKLRFLGGRTGIRVDGNDTCEKLQDIASYVRAAENSKRQKIIREGAVKDNIVEGIQGIEE